MVRLTHHFHLNEFLCRDGTPYPAAWIADRLRPLCLDLQYLRDTLGRPIYISSGYRTYDYNRAIGGAPHSQHVEGRAADLLVTNTPPTIVYATIRDLIQRGELHHIRALGAYPTFTHVDTRPSDRLVQWKGSRVAN